MKQPESRDLTRDFAKLAQRPQVGLCLRQREEVEVDTQTFSTEAFAVESIHRFQSVARVLQCTQ